MRMQLQGWLTSPSHIWHEAAIREPEERPRIHMLQPIPQVVANTWQPNEKADEKNRLITGNRHSSPFSSQTVRQLKRHPLACKKHRLNKKTSLNISFGTRGSIIQFLRRILHIFCEFWWNLSGCSEKLQQRVTCVAFSIKFAKTN